MVEALLAGGACKDRAYLLDFIRPRAGSRLASKVMAAVAAPARPCCLCSALMVATKLPPALRLLPLCIPDLACDVFTCASE